MKYAKCAYELSRPLQADKISAGGVEERIEATALEMGALIERFALLDLSRLEAVLNVDRAQRHTFSVTGTFRADVVMPCVVTLEPVSFIIKESIDVLFAPPHLVSKKDDTVTELGDLELPEPIINGIIDLGELVSQHLAMALPLYPRQDGVQFEAAEYADPEAEEKNPFLRLKNNLKNDNKSKG